MSIIALLRRVIRPNVSGLTLYVEHLSEALARRGHAVTVLTHRHEASLPARAEENGVRVVRAAVAARIGKALVSPAILASAVAELSHTDVAHLHAPSRHLTPSILEPLERAKVPVVMTLHDFKPWCTNRILFAKGEPCERCRGGRHWRATATGCVQGSRLKSVVGTLEAVAHRRADAE